MQNAIEFFVKDRPRPGGSKRAVYNPKTKRSFVRDDSDHVKVWREAVREAARDAYDGPPLEGPVSMTVSFRFRRPKGHYGSGRNAQRLKASAPAAHIQRPDLTKLIRSTEDAMKGIVWHDDCQVNIRTATKVWVHRWDAEGASISIRPADAEAPHAE